MSYLTKLREIEEENDFSQPSELSKPTKPPFGSFDSSIRGTNTKKNNCNKPSEELESDSTNEQEESRRQKVLEMLASNPETQRAVIADQESDPDHVIITIGIRSVATFELMIDKSRFDPFALLDLIDKQSMSTH